MNNINFQTILIRTNSVGDIGLIVRSGMSAWSFAIIAGGIGFIDRSGISGCSFIPVTGGVGCSSSNYKKTKEKFVKINNKNIGFLLV